LHLAEVGQFGEAEPLLLQLHERHPRDVEVVRALAIGYAGARRFAETEHFMDCWCQLQPGASEPFRRRMEMRLNTRQPEQAYEDVQRILVLDTQDTTLRREEVRLLLVLARYEEAERACLRHLKTDPTNLDLWYFLAQAYHRQGRTALAADTADRLLRSAPQHPGGLVLRGELYLDADQPEQAIPFLRKAAAMPGEDQTAALYQLNLALTRAHQDEEASRVRGEWLWHQALDTWAMDGHRDTNLELQSRVVDALVAAGHPGDAIRFLTNILKRNPQATAPHQLLASLYEKQGQPERAAEHRRLAGLTP
jgi:predicted Zn-dependent protease